MENKINVAELLKDCPKGMELDCVLFNNPVRYDGLDNDDNYPITILTENDDYLYLTEEGYLYNMPNSKCVIFPKGKTTWEGFVPTCQFKDGDIISDSFGSCIFKGEGKIKGTVDYYCGISSDSDYFSVKDNKCRPDGHYGNIVDYRLATEEEKEKLFQAIKENGYNWNSETKTLEKLVQPKFKVGDIIRNKETKKRRTVTKIHQNCYECDDRYVLEFKNQDYWELVPNKFDISTLVPFESKVLIRNDKSQHWIPAFWGYKHEYKHNDGYTTTFGWVRYCIPYEGNEHLLGTINDCNEYFKTWE